MGASEVGGAGPGEASKCRLHEYEKWNRFSHPVSGSQAPEPAFCHQCLTWRCVLTNLHFQFFYDFVLEGGVNFRSYSGPYGSQLGCAYLPMGLGTVCDPVLRERSCKFKLGEILLSGASVSVTVIRPAVPLFPADWPAKVIQSCLRASTASKRFRGSGTSRLLINPHPSSDRPSGRIGNHSPLQHFL